MDRWIDGSMDRWIDGWMDGWMDMDDWFLLAFTTGGDYPDGHDLPI